MTLSRFQGRSVWSSLLDVDSARLVLLGLGNNNAQDAILKLGRDVVLIDTSWEVEAARELAEGALGEPVLGLITGLLLDLLGLLVVGDFGALVSLGLGLILTILPDHAMCSAASSVRLIAAKPSNDNTTAMVTRPPALATVRTSTPSPSAAMETTVSSVALRPIGAMATDQQFQSANLARVFDLVVFLEATTPTRGLWNPR